MRGWGQGWLARAAATAGPLARPVAVGSGVVVLCCSGLSSPSAFSSIPTPTLRRARYAPEVHGAARRGAG